MEWPIWQLVLEKGIPLTEINKWDLEDIYKAFSLCAMKMDYSEASVELKKEEIENIGNK